MAYTYEKQLQDIVQRYRQEKRPWPTTARDMAVWAINNKLWLMRDSQVINRCADDLAKAMRDEYITDPQGRRVRAKHAAKVPINGKQMTMWDDIRTAKQGFMAVAFQQRRKQIVGDCSQLKADVDSYNQNYNPSDQIEMVFDFTLDILEEEVGAAA